MHARCVAPESRKAARSSGGAEGVVDLAAAPAPLSLMAGELDHIIPAALNRESHAAYTDAKSVSDPEELTGRTHWICRREGWEGVTSRASGWIDAR